MTITLAEIIHESACYFIDYPNAIVYFNSDDIQVGIYIKGLGYINDQLLTYSR